MMLLWCKAALYTCPHSVVFLCLLFTLNQKLERLSKFWSEHNLIAFSGNREAGRGKLGMWRIPTIWFTDPAVLTRSGSVSGSKDWLMAALNVFQYHTSSISALPVVPAAVQMLMCWVTSLRTDWRAVACKTLGWQKRGMLRCSPLVCSTWHEPLLWNVRFTLRSAGRTWHIQISDVVRQEEVRGLSGMECVPPCQKETIKNVRLKGIRWPDIYWRIKSGRVEMNPCIH